MADENSNEVLDQRLDEEDLVITSEDASGNVPPAFEPAATSSPVSLRLSENAAPVNPLTRKLTKILETRLDNTEMLTALEALSTFYPENTLKARRNLRGDIERRSTSINRRFLEAFSLVNQEMTKIDEDIGAMSLSCRAMQERLLSARQQTSQLLNQTSVLTRERDLVLDRKKIVHTFLSRFTLTPEQAATISGTKELKPEFFDVLQHLRSIHNECKALLLSDHQRAGLEFMESVSLYQEAAFEKLFRWMQTEAKSFSRPSPDISLLHQKSMSALRDRPVLYQSCLEEICNVRRSVIVQLFIDALTRGGPGGTPKPIELHAHDPMRYVSDMLAWLHQAIASEREFLEGLLSDPSTETDKEKSGNRTNQTGRGAGNNFNWAAPSANLQQALERIAEGTGRPLKVRVDQLLVSQPETLVAFRLSHLLQFYTITIEKITGSGTKLARTLTELTQSAFKVFFDAVGAHTDKLSRNVVPPPSGDLSPPSAVTETLDQLKDILASYDVSLVPSDQREHDITPVVNAILTPLQQLTLALSASLNKLEGAILQLNCLHVTQNALVLFPFTSKRAQTLDEQIDAHIHTIAKEQAQTLLKNAGLLAVVEAIDKAKASGTQTPFSRLPGLDARTLAIYMENFHSNLFALSPESFVANGIVSTRLARQAGQLAVKLFVRSYQSLAQVVYDTANQYEFPATLIVRTPEEVATLLGTDLN